MIAWMVYAALIGVLIAAAALALERLAASAGRPRRFVWLLALALAVVVPLAGGLRNPVPEVLSDIAALQSSPLGTIPMESRRGLIPPLPIPANPTAARTAAFAWGAGSAAALGTLCTVLLLVARARRRWQRSQVDGTDVYVSRRFGPALVGIVAPKPVIPSWVLEAEPAARATILRHEQEHARARDHFTLLYAGLVAAVFPWSPAIWWMCRRLRAAVEMDCDQRVIAGGIGPADYGAVLLHAGSRCHGRWGLAPAMSQPKSLLERRLRTMSEKRKRLTAAHGVLLAAAGLVALGIACDVPSPTQLDDAIEEVVAAGQESRNGEMVVLTFGDPAPFIFVDGERVSAPDWMGSIAAEDIARVEILKGAAARMIHGEEAAGGVIEIFTVDKDSGVERVATFLSGTIQFERAWQWDTWARTPDKTGQLFNHPVLEDIPGYVAALYQMPYLRSADIRTTGGLRLISSGTLKSTNEEQKEQ